jgi:PTH1 family peptidyl-tRNA hydrolase
VPPSGVGRVAGLARRMENSYLIVGLGNPGGEYAKTRHNAGFLVAELLAQRWRVDWSFEKKFQARLARADRAERRALLCEPQTYMNSSGEAVAAVVDFYRVPLAQVLVVVDDADLPLGELRLRPDGSSGGHHGLESIEQHLGSRAYARLRIGIGRQDGAREIRNHVLGRFSSTEAALADKVFAVAADQAEVWLLDGAQKAMNRFNGAAGGSPNERKEQ